MTKYTAFYLVLVLFLAGLVVGMVQYEFLVPALGDASSPYYRGIRGRNMVSLTFNVDWGTEYIPRMLEIFSDRDVRVTFFVTGEWAENNPGLLQEISRNGHEIGNHGYSHRHPLQLSTHQLRDLITRNESVIYRITGQRPKLFSPPYGEVNSRINKTAAELGYRTIMWSTDSIDWQRPAPEIIVRRVVTKIEDGGIALLHPTEPTVKALPSIIDRLKNRGFKLVPVSELIGLTE